MFFFLFALHPDRSPGGVTSSVDWMSMMPRLEDWDMEYASLGVMSMSDANFHLVETAR
jgi:hypothetical protein